MPPLSSARSIAANEQTNFQSLATPWLSVERLKQMLVWLVLPVTVGLAITHQSLWMDEGYTVWFASHKGIGSFFSALIGSPGSTGDPQMLFYLLYMWGWVKVFGESEVALRAANIPFALLFLGTISWAFQRFLQMSNLWLLFCLSPFFWFYLNDARPYVALMTFAAVAIVALLAYLADPAEYAKIAPWCCLLALFLTWGIHILGALLFPSMIALALAATMGDRTLRSTFLRDWSRPFLCCLPAFLALGTFFVWVSAHGINKQHGEPGFPNAAFVLYEFLGFGGLGPPRLELRQNPHLSAFAPYWPLLLLGVAPLLLVAFLLLRVRPSRIAWHLTVSLLIGVAVAMGIARIEHFQILGRHMAVFFPLLLITVALAMKPLLSSAREQRVAVAALVAIAAVWAISDARLVFLSKYERDAYRSASSIAEAKARQDGGQILWVADIHAAGYYGIQVTNDSDSAEMRNAKAAAWRFTSQAVDGNNWSREQAASYVDRATKPLILVLSRPDLFDTAGAWSALVEGQKPAEVARLAAFSIYEWQPKPKGAATHTNAR
jgi:hypothetical protein